MSEMTRQAIYQAIDDERTHQDAQWGGPAHDDEHDPTDWLDYIEHQGEFLADSWELLGNGDFPDEEPQAETNITARFIKIAALAVAGLESWQRKAQRYHDSIPAEGEAPNDE
ncbi:MAG TPA: hypothetical protein VMV29_09825 [Ktedonobacterales bacterium]|nr:hypothetical protein [Ktedonobacterales bacterium]